MTLLQKIGTVAGLVTGIGGALTYITPPLQRMYQHIDRVMTTTDSVTYLIGKNNELQQMNIMILNDQFKIERMQDSICKMIEFTNNGKFPYDTLWVKSQSGHYYKTTLKSLMDNGRISN